MRDCEIFLIRLHLSRYILRMRISEISQQSRATNREAKIKIASILQEKPRKIFHSPGCLSSSALLMCSKCDRPITHSATGRHLVSVYNVELILPTCRTCVVVVVATAAACTDYILMTQDEIRILCYDIIEFYSCDVR